jgi:uncharacterized protein YbjT (DUF2867 family)
MITVMGATGNTGGSAASALLAAEERVRVLGRSEERLQDLAGRGAEPAAGEATDPAYLARAFRGADAAYAMIPPNYATPDLPGYYEEVGAAIAKAVEEAGLGHLVFLSSLGAELPSGTGPIALLHAVEQRLRGIGGLNLLILRPGYFFENHLGALQAIRTQGRNADALAPEAPLPMLAAEDIGARAAEALRKRDFEGVAVQELLGPRDLTMSEVTRILGASIGRPDLPYVQLPYGDYERVLVEVGLPEGVAALFSEMARALNEGRVHSREGRHPGNTTPTTLESFAESWAEAYRAL